MTLLRRIGFYLVGFAIGLIILAYVLKEKNTTFCYSPNCRVLKNIRSKKLSFNEKLQGQEIDTNLFNYILTKGKVSFSKSDTKTKPCKKYIISGSYQEKNTEVTIKNCDSTAIVQKIELKQ
ncbi:DUF4258 domain-containing protein [Leptobacterium sp. I13]|uniref:DUF4258 domain-containing protein n=1 Tax=Leptobacterium meishanense TaxID=3128904 RepID=UPI0030ED5CB8